MLQLDLVAEHFGNVRPFAGFAKEAALRDHAKLPVHRNNAAIKRDFLTGIFELVDQPGRIRQLDRDRGHEPEPFGLDGVAETARILVEADKANPDIIAQRGLCRSASAR